MVDPQARRTAKAGQPRRLDPDSAVQNTVVLADQDGHAEAERADRSGHLIDMRGVEFANLTRRHSQVVERYVNEMKRRQGIVSHFASLDARFPEPVHLLAAAAALGLQLIT